MDSLTGGLLALVVSLVGLVGFVLKWALKRMERVEARMETLQDRFLKAMEDLTDELRRDRRLRRTIHTTPKRTPHGEDQAA